MQLLVKDLSFGYSRNQRVLDGVSLKLESGLLTGILGPNGSGKTTLLRLMTGNPRPDAGELLLDDEPIARIRPRALAQRMALVPQRSEISFDFTALDVVLMGRQPHLRRFQSERPEDIEAAHSAMARLDVLDLAARRVSELSGGEWQRVTIARAICQRAKLLLLDEPVSSLDIRYQIETLRMVRDLVREDGVACCCVLHDINLAAHFCDALYVLYKGRVYDSGAPEKVVTERMLAAVYGIPVAVMRDTEGKPQIIPNYG